jgi:glycosyltransferase involved in cell wall biosynthesis
MTPSLSAILIAKDEERDLPECLKSLKGCAGEIVVVVSDDTTDRTETIAKEHGARTIKRKFDDYARQRQASLDLATGEWCLWIDPDERLTPELAESIRRELSAPRAEAYDIPFRVRFLGRDMRWGGLGSESHVRLFRREKSRFAGGALHEGIEVEGETARLSGAMIHEPYRDLADYLEKLDRYTTLAARKRLEAGRRANPLHHLLLPWEFFARAVLKLGVLDGRAGLVWAGLAAFHSWLKYVKLAEMQRGGKS